MIIVEIEFDTPIGFYVKSGVCRVFSLHCDDFLNQYDWKFIERLKKAL